MISSATRNRPLPMEFKTRKAQSSRRDDRYVVVYSNDRFAICEVSEAPEGKFTLGFPPSGIAAITFSGNGVIIVTDPNGKQKKYYVTGGEVQ